MLNGDVRITRGRLVITADRGRYDRSQGMLYLDDRVRMVDSTTRLTTDHAQYSENDDVLLLFRTALCDEDDAVTDGNVASHSVGLEARDNARRRGGGKIDDLQAFPTVGHICERAAQRALGCLSLAEDGLALPTQVLQSGWDTVSG